MLMGKCIGCDWDVTSGYFKKKTFDWFEKPDARSAVARFYFKGTKITKSPELYYWKAGLEQLFLKIKYKFYMAKL